MIEVFVDRRDVAATTSGDGEVGLIAVHNFEQQVLQCRLDAAVDRKLLYWEKRGLVVLPLSGKETEILLDLLIHAFSLSIRLRMICGHWLAIDAELLVQGLDELGYELQSPITDDTP